MKYTVKKLKDKAEITFNLTPEEWEDAINEAYKKHKGDYSIPGFNKGRAPRKMIEKHYGDTVFFDDALDGWFYKHYFEVLSKEKDIAPVDAPHLKMEKLDSTGVVLVAAVEVKPEVKLGAYTGIVIERTEPKVTAKEVDAELAKMQQNRARFVEVEREAKTGDFVTIDFEGSIDAKPFEGGSAKDYELELGSKSFVDTFEEQIAGMKIGETRDIKIVFPDNYPVEKLAKKETIFKVSLKTVKEKTLPALDDAFASDTSEFETLKDLKEDIKKKLLETKTQEQQEEQESKLIEKITANAKVEISETLINNQIDDYIEAFEYKLKGQGLNIDDFFKYTNSSMEKLRESRREDAKKTAKTRLVLEAILEKENITVTDKDIEDKFNEFNKDKPSTIDDIRKTLGDEQMSYFENNVLLNKLMTFFKKNNTI